LGVFGRLSGDCSLLPQAIMVTMRNEHTRLISSLRAPRRQSAALRCAFDTQTATVPRGRELQDLQYFVEPLLSTNVTLESADADCKPALRLELQLAVMLYYYELFNCGQFTCISLSITTASLKLSMWASIVTVTACIDTRHC
jgi:hypothetical protein